MFTLLPLTGSVPTGDERQIGLWIVLAAIALALIILCALLSVISKHKKK